MGEKKVEAVEEEEKPEEEKKIVLGPLLAKVSEIGRNVDAAVKEATEVREKALKKIEAKKKMDSSLSAFTKHDKDRDGFLNKKEVTAYAKVEFKFDLTTPALNAVWRVIVGEGKGVAKADFQSLKVAVGVQREKVADVKRKEVRIARETAIAAKTVLDRKLAPHSSAYLNTVASEIDEASEEAKGAVADALEAVAGLAKDKQEDLEPELNLWYGNLEKNVKSKTFKFEDRLKTQKGCAEKYRADAKKKELQDFRKSEQKAMQMIRYHRTARVSPWRLCSQPLIPTRMTRSARTSSRLSSRRARRNPSRNPRRCTSPLPTRRRRRRRMAKQRRRRRRMRDPRRPRRPQP